MGHIQLSDSSGAATVSEIDILWLTAGLGCDGRYDRHDGRPAVQHRRHRNRRFAVDAQGEVL